MNQKEHKISEQIESLNHKREKEMNQPSPLKIAKMELQGLTMLYNTMVHECWSKCIPNTKEVSRFTLIFSLTLRIGNVKTYQVNSYSSHIT